MIDLYAKIHSVLADNVNWEKPFFCRPDITKTYGDAYKMVSFWQDYLRKENIEKGEVIAIEANKEFEVYCLFLACCLSGITYVPFSQEQTLERVVPSILALNPQKVFITDIDVLAAFVKIDVSCFVINEKNCRLEDSNYTLRFETVSSDQFLYIMFSSGTTGAPKAIPIQRGNVGAYIDSIEAIVSIDNGAGFSQIAALTFDLSVHDIYLCFSNAGYLCPIGASEAILAYRFANELSINYWMSVPSTVAFMFQYVKSIPALNSIKCTFFLGEALATSTALRWAELTPRGAVFNLYGPTECTVAASFVDIRSLDSVQLESHLVPIGQALKNCHLYRDPDAGELLLSGDQLFPGYLGEADSQNGEKFISIDDEKYYRTGDLVEQDDVGVYRFLGRSDFQVKLRGYRVELEELESILIAFDAGEYCVVPWGEIEIGNFQGVRLLANSPSFEKDIIDACKNRFPRYVVVNSIVRVDKIPRNINGKIDRRRCGELV